MEQFLRIWSIIVMAILLIKSVIITFEDKKLTKQGILFLLLYTPVFYYIIKF